MTQLPESAGAGFTLVLSVFLEGSYGIISAVIFTFAAAKGGVISRSNGGWGQFLPKLVSQAADVNSAIRLIGTAAKLVDQRTYSYYCRNIEILQP